MIVVYLGKVDMCFSWVLLCLCWVIGLFNDYIGIGKVFVYIVNMIMNISGDIFVRVRIDWEVDDYMFVVLGCMVVIVF